jgi:hypothetical protein
VPRPLPLGLGVFVALTERPGTDPAKRLILLLHVVGWGVLIGIVAPQHYQVSSTHVPPSGLPCAQTYTRDVVEGRRRKMYGLDMRGQWMR